MEKGGTEAGNSAMVLEKEENELEVEDEDKVKQREESVEKFGPWSSRMKCYAAYVCGISSYLSFQKNCTVLASGGLLTFIPFILLRIFIGIPAVIILVVLGRYTMSSPAKTWAMYTLSKGILVCELAVTTYFIVNSLIITTYLISYFFLSFSLPWENCSPEWASQWCYESSRFNEFYNRCLANYTKEYCDNVEWETSGAEYWKYVAAEQKNAQSMGFNFLYLFGSIVFIFIIIIKGIPSSEKAFLYLTVFSFILIPLVAFLVCFTQEMPKGLKRIAQINWDELLDGKAWVLTYDSVIFTLAIGRLGIAFVSAHAKFEDDIFSEVLIICFTDIFLCLVIALPTVCVLEEIKSRSTGIDVNDGLHVFISLSELVLLFPFPNRVWAVIFYAEMVVMSFGSIILSMLALVETIISFAKEHFNTFYTSLVLCIFWLFLCTIFFFYDFSFSILLDKGIIGILFLYLFTLQILYGFQRFTDDFHFMMGYSVPFFLKFCWVISLPASFAMIILHGITFSDYQIVLAIPFILFLLTACAQIGLHLYKSKQFKELFKINPDWGPSDPLLRKSRILFDSRAVTKEFTYRQELQEKPKAKPPDITEQAVVHVV